MPTARRDANQSRRGRADAQALDDFKLLLLICLPMALMPAKVAGSANACGTAPDETPMRYRRRLA